MGISDFRKIKDTHIESLSFADCKKQIPPNTNINIHVDGSFYLFSGYTTYNLDTNSNTFIPEYVAETAAAVIYNKIAIFKKLFVKSKVFVYVYFDGKSPFNKHHTSNKRKLKQKNDLKYKECMNLLIEKLNEHNYIIYNLIVGEAEHEMITHRTANNPSFIMTDDTDIFHIAYKLDSITYNDYMFNITKDNSIYDIINLDIGNMPKICFSILCHLKGSDYFPTIITVSMFLSIINAFKNYENEPTVVKNIIDDINSSVNETLENERAIELRKNTLIHYNNTSTIKYTPIDNLYSSIEIAMFIKKLILIVSLTDLRVTWCKQNIRDVNEMSDNILNVLNMITWAVNYSYLGASYKNYTNLYTLMSKPNSYTFYAFLLTLESGDDLFNKINHFIKIPGKSSTTIKARYKEYAIAKYNK
ncbi:FEN-1 [Macrobrachium rosenbergii nudivirus]|nr:FEN-1 [Macrobrachium rosenbergii nudivirus]